MGLFEQKYPNNTRQISGVGNVPFQDDVILLAKTSLGVVSLTLLEVPANYWNTTYKLYVVDADNNAAVNNITINAPVGYTINGASSVVISASGGSYIFRVATNTGYAGQYSASGGGATINGHLIQDEGVPLPQQPVIDFQGAGVTATNGVGKTIVTIPTGNGHVIADEGVALPQQPILNFVGNSVAVTNGAGETTVTILDATVGYTVIQDEGVPLPPRSTIDFQGAGVVATDGGTKTIVTIAGGGGGAVVSVVINGNPTGTQMLASATGGTAPYTYLWSEAQNIQQRFNAATAQVQTPSTPLNLAVLGINITGALDAYGTSVMWKCIVTDSLGNKGIGYYTNASPSIVL